LPDVLKTLIKTDSQDVLVFLNRFNFVKRLEFWTVSGHWAKKTNSFPSRKLYFSTQGCQWTSLENHHQSFVPGFSYPFQPAI